jgi:hypothetical protein
MLDTQTRRRIELKNREWPYSRTSICLEKNILYYTRQVQGSLSTRVWRICRTHMRGLHSQSSFKVVSKLLWIPVCFETTPTHTVPSLADSWRPSSHTRARARRETKVTIICLAFSVTLRGALADNTQTSCLCVCIKFLFENQNLCPLCITTKGKERLSRTMCTCKVCTDATTAWIEVVATESSAKMGPGGWNLTERFQTSAVA